MPNTSKTPGQLDIKSSTKSTHQEISYRGFVSIDQEMEREIAMQWLSASGKSSFSKASLYKNVKK